MVEPRADESRSPRRLGSPLDDQNKIGDLAQRRDDFRVRGHHGGGRWLPDDDIAPASGTGRLVTAFGAKAMGLEGGDHICVSFSDDQHKWPAKGRDGLSETSGVRHDQFTR